MDVNGVLAWAGIAQAVGTAGAFAVAGWLLARELRRDREKYVERKKAQARLVFAWNTSPEMRGMLTTDTMTECDLAVWGKTSGSAGFGLLYARVVNAEDNRILSRTSVQVAHVENSSEAPIYDVRIPIGVHHGLVGIASRGLIGDDDSVFALEYVVPPGSVIEYLWARTTEGNPLAASRPLPFTFTDASGLRWYRDHHGELHELCATDEPFPRYSAVGAQLVGMGILGGAGSRPIATRYTADVSIGALLTLHSVR